MKQVNYLIRLPFLWPDIFVVIDYITGILLATYEKNVSSNIGYKGIARKIMIFIIVGVDNIIDRYIIGTGSSLRMMLILFYLTNEEISIIENTGKMGIPLPQKLKDIITQLQNNNK